MKYNKFVESGGRDPAYAFTQKDMEIYGRLQEQETALQKEFSDTLTSKYRPIAEQLDALKSSINQYIYRPINTTVINRD